MNAPYIMLCKAENEHNALEKVFNFFYDHFEDLWSWHLDGRSDSGNNAENIDEFRERTEFTLVEKQFGSSHFVQLFEESNYARIDLGRDW